MRKLLRSIARHNMKRAGITQINKTIPGGSSFFALNWREYAAMKPPRVQQRRRKVKEARA